MTPQSLTTPDELLIMSPGGLSVGEVSAFKLLRVYRAMHLKYDIIYMRLGWKMYMHSQPHTHERIRDGE